MRGLHGPLELQREGKTRQDAVLDAEGPAGLSACPPPPIPESRGPRTPFLILHVGEGSWNDAGDAMRCFLGGHSPPRGSSPSTAVCLYLLEINSHGAGHFGADTRPARGRVTRPHVSSAGFRDKNQKSD